MPKAFDKWQVFPHRPIEKLEPNLWRVEGDLPDGNGTRVMTIVKKKNGELVIHNAIALEEDAMKEIDAFGDVTTIIVPSGYHRLDAKVFKERYPKAKFVAPEGAKKKVEQVVQVDGTYAGKIDDTITLTHLDGLKGAEGIMEIDSDGKKTLVFNDCINNLPKLGGVFGFMLAPTGMPAVPRITRWFMVKDMKAFRANLEKLAETKDLARVIVSHGKPLTDDPGGVLKTVAARLG
jgi:hypothetical protein